MFLPHTHTQSQNDIKETIEGDVYAHYIDCGGAILGVCMHPN